MDKVNVNGKDSHDVFNFLKTTSGQTGSIKWVRMTMEDKIVH